MDKKQSIDEARAAVEKMDTVVDKLKYNTQLTGAWEKVRVGMIRVLGKEMMRADDVLAPVIHVRVVTLKNGFRGVYADDLYTFLGYSGHYQDWLSIQAGEYGFDIDADFVASKNDDGIYRHVLSTDMAKQLAMVDPGEQGREVRLFYREISEMVSPDWLHRCLKGENLDDFLKSLDTKE